jgi:hypothetical protein
LLAGLGLSHELWLRRHEGRLLSEHLRGLSLRLADRLLIIHELLILLEHLLLEHHLLVDHLLLLWSPDSWLTTELRLLRRVAANLGLGLLLRSHLLLLLLLLLSGLLCVNRLLCMNSLRGSLSECLYWLLDLIQWLLMSLWLVLNILDFFDRLGWRLLNQFFDLVLSSISSSSQQVFTIIILINLLFLWSHLFSTLSSLHFTSRVSCCSLLYYLRLLFRNPLYLLSLTLPTLLVSLLRVIYLNFFLHLSSLTFSSNLWLFLFVNNCLMGLMFPFLFFFLPKLHFFLFGSVSHFLLCL